MNKIIKYIGYGVLIVIVFILSVDVKNLDNVQAAKPEKSKFDATKYAQNFWTNQLDESLEKAVDLSDLLEQLENNFAQTGETGQKIGISDYRYFLVRDSGTVIAFVTDLLEKQIIVELESSEIILLASGYIFGNTVINALPAVEIGKFVNITQFNLVSVEINKLVEEQIVAHLNEEATVGRDLNFVGTLSINVKNRNVDSLRVIPLQINFSDK